MDVVAAVEFFFFFALLPLWSLGGAPSWMGLWISPQRYLLGAKLQRRVPLPLLPRRLSTSKTMQLLRVAAKKEPARLCGPPLYFECCTRAIQGSTGDHLPGPRKYLF